MLLHGGSVLPQGHAYRYAFNSGYLEPIRVLSGWEPLLVLDASARPDPFVVRSAMLPSPTAMVFGTAQPRPYDQPIAAGGPGVVETLKKAALDATHFRLLQGPIYPPATKPCHAVTLILAVRATALTERLDGFRHGDEWVDVGRLDRAWENMTGADTVEIDLTVLELPQDDPGLEVLSRGPANPDTTRAWIEMNWDRYWVPHEGCEPYVSFLVQGDATDGTFGIAMYDVETTHRVSFSSFDDELRFRDNYEGPGSELLATRPASRTVSDWVTFLYAHETGHLFGQTHPHNVISETGDFTFSWSSVVDAMSYETGDRTTEFGAVAMANYQRNRAGYLVQETVAQGHAGSAEFAQALRHLELRHWQLADDALLQLLAPAS